MDLYKHCCRPPFHLSASRALKLQTKILCSLVVSPIVPKPAVLPLEDFSSFQSFT